MSVSVLYDIGPAVHQGAGLARYAERLAVHLRRDQRALVDLHLFYNAHSGHGAPATLHDAPVHSLRMGQIAWRLSVLVSQLARQPYRPIARMMRAGAPRTQPMLYHATEHLLPYFTTPTVLTVHDLIFERYPEHHTPRNVWFLKVGMRLFTRAATALIAVSRHTRRDLIDLYGAPPDKVHVIYEGIDPLFRAATAADAARVTARYSPDRPYLLMVGTLEPRKNHALALRALAQLKQRGLAHRLVIAGGRGWLFEPIQRLVAALGLTNDVVFAGYVPAEELPPLYTGAACVLLPSLYEGFGFPVLEAMACAAPVVCSNVSSLPEVAGDAALLTPPHDHEALAAAVQLVVTQPALAGEMRRRGQRQAARFRWESCAAATADLYCAVARSLLPDVIAYLH
ncbi:MAG: glycosyltransferase family 4 protein [Caldilineaceae bacterium]|jgi:glycosyltransferase involved in cell wall biosynthesis|nr:glycosyltransferase family 4 protein [Caldilineaceae bacterium]